MLVWINGAFGAGKTHTAFELARRLDGAHIADPELIGYGIHRMLPPSARADFQDRPQWRSAVIATLADADAAAQSPVLVPMTLVNPEYFAEMMSGLRERDIDVRHISLVASPDTLRQRLRSRSAYWVGRIAGREETWAMAQIDRCVTALADQRFAEHIDTDGVRLDEVVEAVAASIGVPLRRPRLDPIRFQAHRVSIGVRHLRI